VGARSDIGCRNAKPVMPLIAASYSSRSP